MAFCSNCSCNDCNGSCEFVLDKLCNGWSITGTGDQDVYVTSGLNVFASGYISYDDGEPLFVTATFYNNNVVVGSPLVINLGSSTGFSATNFNRIEITSTGADGEVASGQICLTPRYQIICD